jgi:hypothetical protein
VLLNRKDVLILALASTVGAVLGTIAVGLTILWMARTDNRMLDPVKSWLDAGVNGLP